MRNIWTIAKREYDQYFISPVAYVVAFAILLTVGVLFGINFYYYSANAYQNYGAVPDFSPVSGAFTFLLVLSTPALTMRLISDEARMGTLELLLTAPIRDFELVLGKWLGAMLYIFSVLAITAIYPVIISRFVQPGIDWNVILVSYLGMILLAGVFLSLGTAISAMFSNQIASFFVILIVLITLWWLIGFPASVIIGQGADLFHYLDMKTHFYGALDSGIINLSDIVYYVSLIALGIFTGTAAVEMRRWK
ncbi:MAG: ABC transporter permease subunit [Anaerolineales bacterium]|nr:ABC transporter permease subunit [Anaerolineales bacterium]